MEQKILIPLYIEYLKDVWKRDKKEIMEYAAKRGMPLIREPEPAKKKDSRKGKKSSKDSLDAVEQEMKLLELKDKPRRKLQDDTLDEPVIPTVKWTEDEAFVRFKRKKHYGDERARKAWDKLNMTEKKKY